MITIRTLLYKHKHSLNKVNDKHNKNNKSQNYDTMIVVGKRDEWISVVALS